MKKITLFFVLVFAVSFAKAQGFVTTWRTTTANESITIPTIPTFAAGYYNYNVNWGDGSPITNEIANATHTYALAGDYTVSITGTFPYIFFDNAGDKNKILSVEHWGTNPWISMWSAFYGCTHLVINATDTPNLTGVTNMSQTFRGATSLGNGTGNWNWDTSHVTSMFNMFFGASAFNQNIGIWNVSQVTSMGQMFYDASAFNQNIGIWNVSQVINMEVMFAYATSFNQNIGNWNTSHVIRMAGMFLGATSFNQDISTWDVSQVIDMWYMFYGISLSTANYDSLLTGWDSQTLLPNVIFNGGNSIACSTAAQAARAHMITSDGWTITDGGTCVADTTAPTVVTQNITVPLDSIGHISITPRQVDNGTTDNSGSFTLSFDAGQGYFTCANIGLNTVTLVATDPSGNKGIATAQVTVVDTMAPTALAKDFVLDLDGQTDNIVVSQIDNGSTDNNACSSLIMSLDKMNFTCADVGVQLVTLTVKDVSGNVSTVTANVTVNDVTPPSVITQNVTVTLDANGAGSVTASQFDNGSTDACDINPYGYSLVIRGISIDFTNLSCTDVGVYTVTLQVTDDNGLVGSKLATLTVQDTTAPTITGPADINAIATSASGAVVTYTPPVGSDNCSPTTTKAAGLVSGSTFPIGITPVTYTVTDPSGNSASYTFNVVVIGNGEDDDHDDHGDHHDHSDNDDDHHDGHGDNSGDDDDYAGDDHHGDDHQSDSQETKVIIYPNPVEDEARVGLNIKKKKEGYVKVYNYKGRKVFSKKTKNLKKGVKVNMKGKKTGTYYVRIKYKGKTYTATLFKKR